MAKICIKTQIQDELTFMRNSNGNIFGKTVQVKY
jgi:hypothetical protein